MISRDSVRCTDPECSGRAEPEQDGDYTYHECLECGYAFGFQRIETLVANPADHCSVGIPEDVRRAASRPMTKALTASQPLPLLTIGRRNAGAPPST